MDAIFGNPVPVLLLGLAVGSALGVGYLNTRHRGFLVAMAAVLAVVVAVLTLERSVKTDREMIAETLAQLASALQADGLPENSPDEVTDTVLRLITKARTKSAQRTREMIEPNLKRAKITRATYSNLRVEIDKESSPPKATAWFDAKVSGEGRPPLNDIVTYRTYPLEFEIEMVYEKDDRYDEPRWLIGDRIFWKVKQFGGRDTEPERFGFDQGQMDGF